MRCPFCKTDNNHGVYRTYPQYNLLCRERICDSCGKKFYTKEEIYDKLTKDSEMQQPMNFEEPAGNKKKE